MSAPVNSQAYWDHRFASKDWEARGGRTQTQSFAIALARRIRLPGSFAGTILDFGCGLGDATPIYASRFPSARILGMDISPAAVADCTKRYGNIAMFSQGDHTNVPHADVIVASNVLEHLSDDKAVVTSLLRQCSMLVVAVPYREHPVNGEHLRSYNELSFQSCAPYRHEVYNCPGWTEYGLRDLYVNVYAKNIARLLLGRPMRRRNRQIVFEFGAIGTVRAL